MSVGMSELREACVGGGGVDAVGGLTGDCSFGGSTGGVPLSEGGESVDPPAPPHSLKMTSLGIGPYISSLVGIAVGRVNTTSW